MKLTSGKIVIPIERDGVDTGEITFDPEDVGFAERFYSLMEGLEQKEQAYRGIFEDGAVVDMGTRLRSLAEVCQWLREQVDEVFGAGSSQIIFGDRCSLELFRQFFVGVEPILRRGRGKKTQKYLRDGGEVME